MSVKDEYLIYRDSRGLKTNRFSHRVILQNFLKDRLEQIWDERPNFSNGGLLTNYMTRYAIGFAYYDCKPTPFCKERCYGLPISGLHDYYMLRLGVITSEAFKKGDLRFIDILYKKVGELRLKRLKIGHWGDAVLEQVPNIANLVRNLPNTTFWWYTRKKNIAIAANQLQIDNLRVYLSLDPSSDYPSHKEYPYGITYLFGDGEYHNGHDDILEDDRLVAIFPLKKGKHIEDPADYGVVDHPKICKEKYLMAKSGRKDTEICLSCSGRCNFSD